MNLRDKIEETITFYYADRDFYDACWVENAADAIITELPDYDAQQARIEELEATLRSILQIPNSDAARVRMMRAFAEDALREKT